jgi:uncharacterized phage infection (PIP) family protein YhgE
MAENKNPIVGSIPLILPLLVVGGGLGYAYAAKLFDPALAQALIFGLAFALGGALLGLQLQGAKKVGEALDHSGKIESDMAQKISDTVSSTYSDVASQLKGTQDALSKVTGSLESSLGGHSSSLENSVMSLTSKLDDTYTSGTDELKSALSLHAGSMKEAGGEWSREIMGSFQQHAEMIQSGVDAMTQLDGTMRKNLEESLRAHTDRIAATTEALSENLSAISDVSKNIEKMLHIQEAIDGALDTMMKSDEFQKTIARMSDHLVKSDELLKQATRPRQIQLVETRVDRNA